MSWAATIAAGASLVGGYMSNKSSKKAASAAAGGYDAATQEQQREYDQSRQDMQPWLAAGQGALGQLQKLNSGDYSSFTNSPDYQFSYTQGLQGLDRSAAAKGNLFSGGQDADVMNFASGLANQNYNNYYNRIASLAGVGQSAASNLASLGQNYATNVGNNAIGAGNAYSSAYQQQGQNNSDTVGALGGILNGWLQNRQAQNAGTGTGTGSSYGVFNPYNSTNNYGQGWTW